MELHRVRSGSKEELESKAYNIGVGISLGNKWFTIENILALTKWALEHTREYVVVYVADSIHAINLEVRRGKSPEKALEQSLEMGCVLMSQVKEAVQESFSSDDQKRIYFAHWSDIASDEYMKKVRYLYDLYETNGAFREAIDSMVRNFVSKEEVRFSDEEIRKLGTYILQELPEQMMRVPADSLVYDAFAYPSDSEIVQLAERILKGEAFPEIKQNIVDAEPKVFLEVR